MMKHCNIILMFSVLMSMIGARTFAHDIEVANADGITICYNWANNNTELSVSYRGNDNYWSNNDHYSGNIIIPESVEYNGKTYKVTSIGVGAFYDCDDLTSVTIPNSVTNIKYGAFEKCRNLASITIPNSITSIDMYAFDDTAWFDNQPNGLVYAGKVVYKYKGTIPENTSIVLDEGTLGIASNAFSNDWNNSGLISIDIPNSVISIGACAFYQCSGLTSITIPNGITNIEYRTFEYCKNLTSITIPNSVESIDSYAFDGTAWYDNQPDGLVYAGKVLYKYKGTIPENTSIVIDEGTLGIAGNAFSNDETAGNNSLISVDIPNSVTNIGSSAFSGCRGLTSITIPNNVTSIREYTFMECRGLTSITLPNSVKSIGHEAFSGCFGLTSITIPNSVTSIGDGAFANCGGLTTILVDESNQVYDSRENCNAIIHSSDNVLISGCKNTIIPNNVNSINKYAFKGCHSLTSITIPNSVTNIGSEAFSGCSSLSSITIPNSVTSIGGGAFYGCSGLTSATIGNRVTSIGDNAFYLCGGLTSITIPNSVTSIGNHAFDLCTGLTSITIPNSVKSIGDYAFNLCTGLSSITIPNNVKIIGDYAFYLCTGLTSITIPNSVTSIGQGTFSHCISLPSITIPNSVTNIGKSAFYGCSILTSITIPNTVTSIGEAAFSGCYSLTSIKIPNSVSSIGNNAFQSCSSLISVTINNETPIKIKSSTFSNRTNAILYVPKGTKNAYAAANYWKEFKEIVELIPNLGDANGDGEVNAADIVEAVNAMNDKASAKFIFNNTELNQDGKIDQRDIDIIINLIFSGM